jgi:hypothetical protein
MTQQLSTHILSIRKEAQQVKFALEKTLHPSRGQFFSCRGEGGVVWMGGLLWSPAVPLFDVDLLNRQIVV